MHLKNRKKHIKFILTCLIAGSVFVNSQTVQAAGVKDLDLSSDYARSSIEALIEKNIISGDNYGNFNPRKTINRAEMVTMLVNSLKLDTTSVPEVPTFKDVPKNHWAYKYVETAYREGIVSGISEDSFGPDSLCTREQMATMFVRSLGISNESILEYQGLSALNKFADGDKIADWAKAPVQFAVSNGIMSGMSSITFSPKGEAKREQAAVVTYSYFLNRDKIEVSAKVLKEPMIVLNGDVIETSVKPMFEKDEVLVPASLFLDMGAQVSYNEQSGTVMVQREGSKEGIYFKEGSSTAYIGAFNGTNPFESTGSADSNVVALDAAPVKTGNELMVPVKTAAKALGAEALWNVSTGLVTLKDSTVPDYPNLYKAMKASSNYNGEYGTKIIMTMSEKNRNEAMSINMQMSGAINGKDATSKVLMDYNLPGYPREQVSYDTVRKDDKVYVKDDESGTWESNTLDEARELGIPFMDVESDSEEALRLLDSYGSMALQKVGKVDIGNVSTNKYIITATRETINALMPSEIVKEGIDFEEIYNEGLQLKIEVYVDSQDRIVKETGKLSGSFVQENADVQLDILFDTDYKNIGNDIEINVPVE